MKLMMLGVVHILRNQILKHFYPPSVISLTHSYGVVHILRNKLRGGGGGGGGGGFPNDYASVILIQ